MITGSCFFLKFSLNWVVVKIARSFISSILPLETVQRLIEQPQKNAEVSWSSWGYCRPDLICFRDMLTISESELTIWLIKSSITSTFLENFIKKTFLNSVWKENFKLIRVSVRHDGLQFLWFPFFQYLREVIWMIGVFWTILWSHYGWILTVMP